MELIDFTSGSVDTKPWLNIVCKSVGALTADVETLTVTETIVGDVGAGILQGAAAAKEVLPQFAADYWVDMTIPISSKPPISIVETSSNLLMSASGSIAVGINISADGGVSWAPATIVTAIGSYVAYSPTLDICVSLGFNSTELQTSVDGGYNWVLQAALPAINGNVVKWVPFLNKFVA